MKMVPEGGIEPPCPQGAGDFEFDLGAGPSATIGH
jgi:hypothetical protein